MLLHGADAWGSAMQLYDFKCEEFGKIPSRASLGASHLSNLGRQGSQVANNRHVAVWAHECLHECPPTLHSCPQSQSLPAVQPSRFLRATGSATRSKKMRFPAYASHEELGQGLKKGRFFKGAIRVNAHDRSQAYVTIPGLPSDLMIRVCPRSVAVCHSVPLVEALRKMWPSHVIGPCACSTTVLCKEPCANAVTRPCTIAGYRRVRSKSRPAVLYWAWQTVLLSRCCCAGLCGTKQGGRGGHCGAANPVTQLLVHFQRACQDSHRRRQCSPPFCVHPCSSR